MLWPRQRTKKDILNALREICDPAGQIDVVTLDWVDDIVIQKKHVIVTLTVDPARGRALEGLRREAEEKLSSLRGVASARVILTAQKKPEDNAALSANAADPKNAGKSTEGKPLAPYVKNIIAVASGKGGVGKSTVAANLAVALARKGLKIGLLDADIYGPSMPMLMGVRHQKPQQENDMLIPLEAHGVKIMSMGFLVDEEKAMIWRGPMVQSALMQMLRDVAWGELDILIIDMPPGTGDVQLTVAQRVPLRGAVIVSTPQDIALLDAVKAIEMFRKTSVPILGVIENMSMFCCPNCGAQTPIFGTHGAEERARALHVPFLGALPLAPAIRENSDKGTPFALTQSHEATVFAEIASHIAEALEKQQRLAPKIIMDV